MRGVFFLRLSMILTLVFLICGISPSAGYHWPGQAAEASAPGLSAGNGRWLIETIESTPMVYVGQYVSVAVAPYTGAISISHYDATNQNLRHVKYWGPGGNCGEHNDWYCWERDGGSAVAVGQYSSLALEPIVQADTYDWAKFAYYHASQGALKYTARDWPGTWHYTIIDDPELPGVIAGKHASLALDSNKTPHIAYNLHSDRFGGEEQLKYATRVAEGTGNCGDDDWQCDTIDSDPVSIGRYASLDLSGGDTPSIAYYDGNFGDLWWARKGGTYTNCGPDDTWACFFVDIEGDVGMFASLVWDKSSGVPHIAYYDATNKALKYATFVLSGGNCGYGSGWQCDEIDEMGANISDDHQRISMALDANGYPIIAYQKTSEIGPAVLKVARPATALGLDHGNCGPEDLFLTWQCDTVDNGGSYTSVGHYVDIAVNAAGLATIAYYESDSYNLSGNLKVARQVLSTYLPLVARSGP